MAATLQQGVDAREAIQLAKLAGWDWTPPGIERALAMEPAGAFTARGPDGAPLGVVTCVLWDALAWIGHLVVAPDARRQGVGRALLKGALAHAEACGATSVGLDATPDARGLCASEGFAPAGESARWEREGPQRAPSIPSGEYAIYPVSSCEIMELTAYDAPRFGASRARWLASLVAEEPNRSFVAVHRRTGAFSGLALALDGRLGPLVAETPAAAVWLLHASERVGLAPRAIVPAWNPAAERLFADAGYRKGRGRTRMARGAPLPGRSEAAYAIGAWGTA